MSDNAELIAMQARVNAMLADIAEAMGSISLTAVSSHWLTFDERRRVSGCHCGFRAAGSDDGYGDSVVRHLLLAQPREPSVSRLIADAREAHERGVKSPRAWGLFEEVIDALESPFLPPLHAPSAAPEPLPRVDVSPPVGLARPSKEAHMIATMLGLAEDLEAVKVERDAALATIEHVRQWEEVSHMVGMGVLREIIRADGRA